MQIPEHYYKRDPSAQDVLMELNAEVRRALIERYDHQRSKGRWIVDVGAELIDSARQWLPGDESQGVNHLLAINLPGDPDGRMVALCLTDPSTSNTYILRVPPDQRTVRGALAWTFNLSEAEYSLQAES